VDCLADSGNVEEQSCARGVVLHRGKAQHVPKNWTSILYVVYIEAGVDNGADFVEMSSYIASLNLDWLPGCWGRRVSQVSLAISVQSALFVVVVEDLLVLIRDSKDTFPMAEETRERSVIKTELVSVGHDRVVVKSTLHVVIGLVLLVQHGSADIRHIDTGITFASDIELLALETECVNKVLPELDKLSCGLGVILGGNMTG
jgi:hypothetical protein